MAELPTFRQALSERVIVFDGAMGTEIYARGVFINRCYDELNLSQPDIVQEIHGSYRKAGADVLTTNTFGANRFRLPAVGGDPATGLLARRSDVGFRCVRVVAAAGAGSAGGTGR
mgnify:CR=1 FL=1